MIFFRGAPDSTQGPDLEGLAPVFCLNQTRARQDSNLQPLDPYWPAMPMTCRFIVAAQASQACSRS